MTRCGKALGVLIVATMALGLSACRKPDSETAKSASSGSSSDTAGKADAADPAVSGLAAEAKAAAMTEVQRHWTKAPDGWITARVSGSAYAPDRYLREIHDLTVAQVESFDLGESDKMNGLEWAGQVQFRSAPCREAGDPGLLLEGMSNLGISVNRGRGRWTQWVEFTPEPMHLQKVKGKWQIPQDTWMLRGSAPTPQDFANAGVK